MSSLERNVAFAILFENLVVSLAWEGTDPEEKHVKDETQAEKVTNWIVFGLHIFDVDDLGSHITGSTTSHKQVFLGIGELCETEVSDYAVTAAWSSENEVFRFEISMHDALAVHFSESVEDGQHDLFSLMRFEFFFFFYFIINETSFK